MSSLVEPELTPLIAQSLAFYAHRTAGRGPGSPEELHEVRASAQAPAASEPEPDVEVIRDGLRTVPIRVHRPTGGGAATGVVLEIHGGGFYMGAAAGSDVRNRVLADTLGVAVVSVDYRLAPEHPWPAAPDDCEAVAVWLTEHAASRFGTTRIAIEGFSAGATLAAATLLRLRDSGNTGFTGAVLQFGTYDLSAQTPAGRLIADEYFLDAYAAAAPDRTHPDISPVFADLTGMPPVLMVVGRDDILLEDNLAMAARMSAADVAVDLRVYPSSPHAFTGHHTPMARAALAGIETWLRGRLGTQRVVNDKIAAAFR